MKISILLLNIFIISLTAVYINGENLHKLVGSSRVATQISNDSRVSKTNIVRSHYQDINKVAFIQSRNDENNGKRIQNVDFKMFLRRELKKFKFLTPRPFVTNPKACPKGTILRNGKCVKAYSTHWW